MLNLVTFLPLPIISTDGRRGLAEALNKKPCESVVKIEGV
jgi:hypothetical protein